jgi:hypothetical protein
MTGTGLDRLDGVQGKGVTFPIIRPEGEKLYLVSGIWRPHEFHSIPHNSTCGNSMYHSICGSMWKIKSTIKIDWIRYLMECGWYDI